MIEDINEVEEFETDDQQLYEHWKIEVDPGQTQVRIDKFLSEKNPYQSRNRIQQAAEAGFIRVNGTPVKSNYKVRPNDVITLVLDRPKHDTSIVAEDIPLDIAIQDWFYMPIVLKNFSDKQTSKFIKTFKEKLDKLNEKNRD